MTEQLETTRNTAESLQSQLISKEAEKADLSRELNELALELKEANGKATSLQRQLSRKEAEETDASRQLKEQAKQLDAAKSTAESLQLRLNEKNDNDEEMEDVTAPHVCDHSECKRQLDDEKQVSQAFREKVLVLEPRNQRLEMPYNEAQAPLKRQLQDVKQARDAAYANVATLKAEKRDLEEKLRNSDGTVEAGIAESARLEHTIQGLKDIAKATRDVQAASHPGGDNLSTTKVGGGGRRKREEDEEQGERLGSEAHAQRVETTGPIAKHIKGPVPKAVVEAPVQAPSRDLLKGKFGHEVGNQIEQWFGIMGEAKRPGIFSTALQTWMKFLMEDFDALQNACQTVALHLNMITVVNLQDHGLMLFAHHLKDLVHYCLKTGIWSPEKIEKMKSVEKYAQMILRYGVEAGAEFKDCKDPNTFYYRR